MKRRSWIRKYRVNYLYNPDVTRSRNCFQVAIHSHFSTTALSLFEREGRLDIKFLNQVEWQVNLSLNS